ATGWVTGTRAFVGRDVSSVPDALARLQTDPGGFIDPADRATTVEAERQRTTPSSLAVGVAAAEGLAGRSWADAEGSPVTAAMKVDPISNDADGHEDGSGPSTPEAGGT